MGETFTLPGPVREAPVPDEAPGPDMITVLASEWERWCGIEAALLRLALVGRECSATMAGPWRDELCAALRQARAALR